MPSASTACDEQSPSRHGGSGAVSDAADRAEAAEAKKLRYAFWFAIAALATLVALALLAFHWKTADGAEKVLAPIAGVVGTIAGAYLGHQAGSAGRERDAAERQRATDRAVALAAAAGPAAERVLKTLNEADSADSS